VTEAHYVGSTGYEAQHPLILTMVMVMMMMMMMMTAMSIITAFQKQKAWKLNTKKANSQTIRRGIKIVVETKLR
jgi:hypothetical protein